LDINFSIFGGSEEDECVETLGLGRIDVRVVVCGGETITVTDPTPLTYDFVALGLDF